VQSGTVYFSSSQCFNRQSRSFSISVNTHTHTCKHARTHARVRAHTHTHTLHKRRHTHGHGHRQGHRNTHECWGQSVIFAFAQIDISTYVSPDTHICICIYICICTWMHMHMYVYVHVCIHLCIHVYIYKYIYMHMYIHMYTNTCIHAYKYIYMYIYICTSLHTYMIYWHIYIHIYNYIYIYIYVYIYTHIYMYMHICIFTYTSGALYIDTERPLNVTFKKKLHMIHAKKPLTWHWHLKKKTSPGTCKKGPLATCQSDCWKYPKAKTATVLHRMHSLCVYEKEETLNHTSTDARKTKPRLIPKDTPKPILWLFSVEYILFVVCVKE